MSETSRSFADFADESYSWKFIERPALTRCIPGRLYTESARVLDIGSGSGRIVNYHVGRGVLAQNIIGVDPDKDMVDIASRRFPEAQFVRQRIQDVELPPGSFDIITAQFVLRYLDNNDFFDLCSRVVPALGTNGLFCMLDIHPSRYGVTEGFGNYYDEGWREVDTPYKDTEVYSYRMLETYLNGVADAGLRLIRFDECRLAEGAREANSEEYANYSQSPARFAIAATVVVG